MPRDELAGAAVDDRHQVRPAVLADPDTGHVELPELAGPLNPEETGSFPALQSASSLDQVVLTHHPEQPLAIDRHPKPAAHKRAYHPVPAGLIRERLLDNHPLDWIADRAPLGQRSRLPVSDTTPADSPADGRDRATRHAHSQPANAFPAISSSYVLGPGARSSPATFRRNSRSPWRSSFPANASRPPLKQLLPATSKRAPPRPRCSRQTSLTLRSPPEQLTGFTREEAVGQQCSDVVGAVDESGDRVCGDECPLARRALALEPMPTTDVLVRTVGPARRVAFLTISIAAGDELTFLHAMHPTHAPSADRGPGVARRPAADRRAADADPASA